LASCEAILGVESAESAHSRDDGESALSDVDRTHVGNDGGDEEDEEVVAVNAADDENVAAVAMVRPRPQSLPAFVGHGVGVSSVGEKLPAFVVRGVGASTRSVSSAASRGGATRNTNTPRRSPTSFISGGGKRKWGI